MQLFFCLILFFAIELSLSIIEFRITTNAMQVEYFFTSSGVSIEIELNSRVPKMRFQGWLGCAVSKIKTNISESESESDKDSDLPGASKLRLLVNFSPASSFWTMLRILSRIAPFDIWFISSPLIELIRNCSLPKVSFLTSCSSCASSSISILSSKNIWEVIDVVISRFVMFYDSDTPVWIYGPIGKWRSNRRRARIYLLTVCQLFLNGNRYWICIRVRIATGRCHYRANWN